MQNIGLPEAGGILHKMLRVKVSNDDEHNFFYRNSDSIGFLGCEF